MSSRIEKGGARFKPSIVPRRSAGGAKPASAAAAASLPSSQTASQPQQNAPSASSGPPISPSLAPAVSARTPKPPSVRTKDTAAAATTVTPPANQPSATPNKSQSYAFNVSPSVISKPGAASTSRAGTATSQAPASTSAAKPAFRKPSVSKPRPGSRASLTPAPQFAQPAAPASATTHAQTLPSVVESSNAQADADMTNLSTRTRIAPSIGSSRDPLAGQTDSAGVQSEAIIEKASQPDPVQAPLRASRSRGASSTQAQIPAGVKESASQQEAQSALQPSRATNQKPASLKGATSIPPSSSNSKGKSREVETASSISEGPRGIKVGSQPAPADDTQSAEDKAAQAAQRRIQAAARLQKRRLKRKELSSGKPRRPLSAYLLFVNSVRPARQAKNPDMSITELTGEIAAEWRGLTQSQRTKWEADASLLRQQYDSALEAWKLAHPEGITLNSDDESGMETTSEIGDDGGPIRRKKRRATASRKPHTVSDDEEEYRKLVYQQGEELAASRLDPANVSMADLSTLEYKKGRAGPRTFEADRVYKRLVSDRRAAGKAALLGGHVLGEKVNHASPSPAPAANIIRTTNGLPIATGAGESLDGEEEIVGDQTGDETSGVEESAPETDADDATDAEGGGASSSSQRARKKREASVAATDVSFRENRFAVQTRIVDGKIVLDETSLFANYGNGEEDRDNMEVVDEREGDRFVNASTYSRKLGRNRKWSADETEKFYRSLQQWGTDFEMIARLFPGRDRVMIKKKFNVEERSNAKMVDAALMNSVPINLEDYAQAIGVDLSGPPPEIKADLQDIESLMAAPAGTVDAAIKKREATAALSGRKGDRSDVEQDESDDGYDYEEVVEIDDDGNEQVMRRRLGKKPGSKAGKKRRNSTRKNSTSTPAPPSSASATAAAEAGEASVSTTTSIAENLAAIDTAASAEPRPSADATGAGKGGKGKNTRSREPPSIGSRKSTRTTRKRAASINSSKEAPGDGMEVEEIVGEL